MRRSQPGPPGASGLSLALGIQSGQRPLPTPHSKLDLSLRVPLEQRQPLERGPAAGNDCPSNE